MIGLGFTLLIYAIFPFLPSQMNRGANVFSVFNLHLSESCRLTFIAYETYLEIVITFFVAIYLNFFNRNESSTYSRPKDEIRS